MAGAIVDRIPVIDIDTHIAEPEDVWTSRVSKKWGDLVPHVVNSSTIPDYERRWVEEGGENKEDDVWILNGKPAGPTAFMAWAGHDQPHPGHPKSLAEANPAAYQAQARLTHMDEVGVQAQLIFPNINLAATQYTTIAENEPELALECCRAYNDFLTEWCSADPKRLLAQTSLPLWDVQECVKEIERCAALGHKAVLMTHSPDGLGLPWLSDPYWNPLWNTAQDLGLPVAFHIGSARDTFIWPGHDRLAAVMKLSMTMFLGNADGIAEVIVSGLCHRFPRLNFVSVESGIGYLPYLLEAMDWQWLNQGGSRDHPEYELKPSEYFKRQIYGSFWFEHESARRVVDLLQDNIMYETDFPHPTSISPGVFDFSRGAREDIEGKLGDVPEEILRKVLHDNAARVYHLD